MELPREALDEYLSEGEEILQRVMSNMTLIEKREHTSETLDSVYRDMHTLKGSSMLFGFSNVGEVSHILEACLDPVRKIGSIPGQDFMNQIYKCLDLIEKYLNEIRETGKELDDLLEEKIDTLTVMVDLTTGQFGKKFEVVNDSQWTGDADERSKLELLKSEKMEEETKEGELLKAEVEEKNTDQISLNLKVDEQKEVPVIKSSDNLIQNDGVGAVEPSDNSQARKGVTKDSSVRVSVDLLDRMMNLVG